MMSRMKSCPASRVTDSVTAMISCAPAPASCDAAYQIRAHTPSLLRRKRFEPGTSIPLAIL
jgi:hypothetical protein